MALIELQCTMTVTFFHAKIFIRIAFLHLIFNFCIGKYIITYLDQRYLKLVSGEQDLNRCRRNSCILHHNPLLLIHKRKEEPETKTQIFVSS